MIFNCKHDVSEDCPACAEETIAGLKAALLAIKAKTEGNRPTVNEQNAFEHFTELNARLVEIRALSRAALTGTRDPARSEQEREFLQQGIASALRESSPTPQKGDESEQQFEDRLLKQDAADNLRLIDYIADKIGLPHNEDLSRENFGAWFNSLSPQAHAGDLIARLLAMPSSLNDACRTMEEAAGVLRGAAQAGKDTEVAFVNLCDALGLQATASAYLDAPAARAALALHPAQGWQDIASAPKNGEPVLIYVPINTSDRRVLSAYWTDAGWWICSGSIVLGKPTLWMPMPTPALPSTSRATGPLVPWELKCQREVCAAPECDCPAMSSTPRATGEV